MNVLTLVTKQMLCLVGNKTKCECVDLYVLLTVCVNECAVMGFISSMHTHIYTDVSASVLTLVQ